LTKVVTFANVKGGTGKSTLCVNVAARLTKIGQAVSAFDADQQKSTYDWISNSLDPNLTGVKCFKPTNVTNFEEVLEDKPDYVLVDTPGSLSKELAYFLSKSTLVVVPCRTSRDDIIGQGWIQLFLEKAGEPGSATTLITVLNCVNKRTSIFKHIREELKRERSTVAETVISQRVAYSETNVNKISVIGYNKFAEAEIESLVREIIDYCEV
jgi:chromosome partitioning protein